MTTKRRSPQPLSPAEEAVVRSLSRIVVALPRAIDADMLREQHMTLTDYTALMHLSEATNRMMRMSEIADALALSLPGTTHIITRLQGQGLVERVRSEQDARGWNAVLTNAGYARLRDAWPSNLASVRRHVLDHLEGIDIEQLAHVFRNVASPNT
jgi:DNA-binding MarR family transcriptional regulator